MIVSNNSRLFGLSHVGVVKCPTFGCVVCTAPDGMFKGCSTIFQAFDGDEWNHSPLVLVARAILRPTLSKKERATVHGIFLEHLDHSGNNGYDLANALNEVFAGAKDAGAVVDTINKAHELWTSDEAKAARSPAIHKFDFGSYKLDDTVSDFTKLVEFSPQEYANIKQTFKGEKIYNAPPVDFLGKPWQLMLSIVQRKIRKIVALIFLSNQGTVVKLPVLSQHPNGERNLDPEHAKMATPVAAQALQYCTERLGSPSEQKTGLFVWDTKGGNVVMQTTAALDGFLIAVFLTSASVRQLEPL